jgi:hypothetical protein
MALFRLLTLKQCCILDAALVWKKKKPVTRPALKPIRMAYTVQFLKCIHFDAAPATHH